MAQKMPQTIEYAAISDNGRTATIAGSELIYTVTGEQMQDRFALLEFIIAPDGTPRCFSVRITSGLGSCDILRRGSQLIEGSGKGRGFGCQALRPPHEHWRWLEVRWQWIGRTGKGCYQS
jgi:hypothetical protein